MRVVVSLTLLLFELLMISAHVLPSLEPNNSQRDIYEIQEGGKEKTKFFAPKPDKPTLREIVYYHVIERPYGEMKLERQSEPIQIEMDDTMRSFTNGHGYQFADMSLHETERYDSPHLDKENANDEEDLETASEEIIEENEDPTLETVTDEKNEKVITDKSIAKEKTTDLAKMTTPSEEKKIRQRQFLFDRLRERYTASLKKNTTTNKPEIVSSTEKVVTTNPTEELETTSKPEVISSTEKAVITNPTEKVETNNAVETTTPVARVKRNVNYEEIPIAPTLPSLDYNNYPGLQVFREPANENTDNEESNEDNLKKAMKFKLNDIFATMKPYDYESATHNPEKKTKSYGMDLSDDQGNVWNNMWRPINYHVGEPLKFYEVNEYEVSTAPPLPEEITTEANTPRDFEDIFVESSTAAKDKEDIYVENATAKSKEDIYVDTTQAKRKTTTEKPDDNKMDSVKEFNEDIDEEEKESEPRDENIASRSMVHKKTLRKGRSKHTNPDLYEQLMNSNKFWEWLAHWTSNYMEIISDRVKDMVKKEVAKQMKNNNDTHLNATNDKSKPEIAKDKELIINNNTLIIDGKKIPITNTSNFVGDVPEGFLKKHNDRNDKHKQTNNLMNVNETKVENNKTAYNDTAKNLTKHEENFNNVSAHNIYGSSTGNDQVTNVFIFYPGTETEKIIESLKPFIGNSISGISTNNKDQKHEDHNKDKPDKDKNKEDKITEKPIETPSPSNPDNLTTLKPVLIDKINKTDEKLPVDNKNTTKLEANKDNEVNKSDTHDSKEPVTEKYNTTTEIIESTSSTEMPNTTETPSVTEKSEPSTVASTEKISEETVVTTTTTTTDGSSDEHSATTLAPTVTSAEISTVPSTLDPEHSTTSVSTEAVPTTKKT